MTNVPPHPAEFSPEVIDVLAELIRPGEHVHDPYGGRGLRLGALCDRLGATFTATDIEDWPGADSRVVAGQLRRCRSPIRRGRSRSSPRRRT